MEPTLTSLLGCLQMQGAALAEFAQALDDEARAMNQGHFAQLPALIERKTELARQIGELDRERTQLQRRAGFDPAGPPRPGEQALHQAWARLRAQASRARADNHRNGVMVHTLLDFTRQALATLHGGPQGLYGSDGRPGGAATGKPLARG